MRPRRSVKMLNRLQFFLQWSVMLLLVASGATAQNKTITLQGSGDAGNSETISLAADANVGVTVNETGIVVTLPVNVRVKCYGDETDDGYCLLAVADGTATSGTNGPLTPAFGSIASQSGGFTVQISNYDGAFSWGTSTTAGSASISSSGVVTVSGLSSGASATVTVTTNRSGYATGTASTTGQATSTAGGDLTGLTPSFGSPSSQTGGFTVQINNYDSAYNWSQSTSSGSVTRNSNGLLTVSGLSAGQSATVTVSTSRSGYSNGSNTVTGQASGSSGGNSSYCSGAPANVTCSGSTTLDDVYGSTKGYTISISPRRIVSMPFTLKDVGSNANQVINLETFTDQAVLADPFKFRLWASKTPGGDAYSAQCDGYSTIARFVSKFVQFNSSRSCALPASGGVFYVNFAVTCQFGTTGCTSTGDMYEYGSLYKFYLSRYIQ